MTDPDLYTVSDHKRLVHIDKDYRSSFRRDYARLIHSPAFRRLQGKTQLFPCIESDFFRNRMTHSLEVAQVANSIALFLQDNDDYFKENPIDADLMNAVCLAHDLGHPPFGHNGERALDDCMKTHGGFEGNAQTLRILSRLEKKEYPQLEPEECILDDTTDKRAGLNLTSRMLASVIKKDRSIPIKGTKGSAAVKGYYHTEKDIVRKIKENVLEGRSLGGNGFKTIECQIMDIADDISNATYDLEDCFKAGFTNPLMMVSLEGDMLDKLSAKLIDKLDLSDFGSSDVFEILAGIFKKMGISETPISSEDSTVQGDDEFGFFYDQREIQKFSSILSNDGYARTQFTSDLVGEFISGIKVEDRKDRVFAKVSLQQDIAIKVKLLKYFTHEVIVMSPRVKVSEYRGYEIIKSIFNALISDSKEDKAPKGVSLLPEDVRSIYGSYGTKRMKHRTICDFIAGMTDRYAIEFYGRLKSENPQTIFKPF